MLWRRISVKRKEKGRRKEKKKKRFLFRGTGLESLSLPNPRNPYRSLKLELLFKEQSLFNDISSRQKGLPDHFYVCVIISFRSPSVTVQIDRSVFSFTNTCGLSHRPMELPPRYKPDPFVKVQVVVPFGHPLIVTGPGWSVLLGEKIYRQSNPTHPHKKSYVETLSRRACRQG